MSKKSYDSTMAPLLTGYIPEKYMCYRCREYFSYRDTYLYRWGPPEKRICIKCAMEGKEIRKGG